MGHTNSTTNLALPQFIGTDKPTWLGDINSAFSDIDAYVGTNDAAVAGAVADAGSAVSQAASAVSTANAANTTAGNASTAATNAVGTANNAMALVNQTNTKIGTLANLATTDKTSIVNAINEVYGIATGSDSVSVTADGVKTYAQIFNDLSALVDMTKINVDSTLEINISGEPSCYHTNKITASAVVFSRSGCNLTAIQCDTIFVGSSSTYHVAVAGSTFTSTDMTSQVPTSGISFKITY